MGLKPLKLMQSLKKSSSLLLDIKRKTVGMILLSVKLSTLLVKFFAPGSEDLVLESGSNDYIVNTHWNYKNLILLSGY